MASDSIINTTIQKIQQNFMQHCFFLSLVAKKIKLKGACESAHLRQVK